MHYIRPPLYCWLTKIGIWLSRSHIFYGEKSYYAIWVYGIDLHSSVGNYILYASHIYNGISSSDIQKRPFPLSHWDYCTEDYSIIVLRNFILPMKILVDWSTLFSAHGTATVLWGHMKIRWKGIVQENPFQWNLNYGLRHVNDMSPLIKLVSRSTLVILSDKHILDEIFCSNSQI